MISIVVERKEEQQTTMGRETSRYCSSEVVAKYHEDISRGFAGVAKWQWQCLSHVIPTF